MDKRKKAYFIKQKIVGAVLVALSVLSVVTLKDATAAIFVAPLGLYAIFSKKMLIFDEYFYEVQEKEEEL